MERYPRYRAWKWWWTYEEELFVNRVWQIGLEAARLAKKERSFVPALKHFQEAGDPLEKEYPLVKERSPFEAFGVRAIAQNYFRKTAVAETQNEMLAAVIALKRYQLRHGKFPTELAALVPEFSPATPHDW